MASDLLSIAASGVKAARLALDVTGQNIAYAGTDGYIRRSASMAEVSGYAIAGRANDISLSGVRISGLVRNADAFRQAEVRRTGADTARAAAEVAGLDDIQAAIEQSNAYPAITGFETALQQLKQNPTDTSLRASALEAARTMIQTFQIASKELDAVGTGQRFSASDGVTQVNRIASELARTNLRLARAADASSDQTSLLDQRDNLLQQLSGYGDVSTTFASDGSVTVQIGGASATPLVSGGTAQTLAMTTNPDGTVAFTTGGAPTTLSGGSLSGQQQALVKLAQIHSDLDTLADSIITTVNTAQTSGTDLSGAAGTALFAGTDAASFSVIASGPGAIATAPASAAAQSRDTTNLDALKTALTAADPAGHMDAIIFDISSTVNGRTVTRDALKTISDSATTALAAQSGVNLDTEAVNLVRFQQAFQASGKVMQVATTLFDTLLNIK